jgi:hypothetical protein
MRNRRLECLERLDRLSPRRGLRAAPLAAWLLAALLVLAQALALGHGVRHGPVLEGAQASMQGDDRHDHDPGSPTCRLLDQLAQDHLSGAAGTASPPPSAEMVLALAAPRGHLGATARPYQARAPPRA